MAFYHIVAMFEGDNSGASDKIKLYVNGVKSR